MVKQGTQCLWWCFTLNNPEEKEEIELLHNSSKYVYQLEEGDDEKTPHYQGVVKLKKRMRLTEIKKLIPRAHFEKARSWKHSVEYCQKEEGRLEGPWVDGFRAPIKDPLAAVELRPFQQEIMEIISEDPDNRTIHWFWENKGNVGKTSLAKHLAISKKNEFLYLSGKASDMKCGITKFLENEDNDLKIVMLDFTRSAEEYISWEGIEAIKNGIFFSGKYESGMLVFNSPHVICLANYRPDKSKLSKDRWNIHKIK